MKGGVRGAPRRRFHRRVGGNAADLLETLVGPVLSGFHRQAHSVSIKAISVDSAERVKIL